MRLLLDVDTGIDDALAIAFALRHPRIQLEGVVTVAGNVGLDLTTRNTLRVLSWLGADGVPVARGAAAPLAGAPREASYWHASDGLGGARLPDTMRSVLDDGVGFLIQRVLAEPGALTVVCTGPCTNLALAARRAPGIVDAVAEVVVMGGAARPPGNVTPVAEFNVYADPHAAAEVFGRPWPITMVGLDVTTRVGFTRSEREALVARDSAEAVLIREVTRHSFEVVGVDAISLHDPLAVAVALEPSLVMTVPRQVDVETQGAHTLGQTVVDLRAEAVDHPSTRVCVDVEAARAKALFLSTLSLG